MLYLKKVSSLSCLVFFMAISSCSHFGMDHGQRGVANVKGGLPIAFSELVTLVKTSGVPANLASSVVNRLVQADSHLFSVAAGGGYVLKEGVSNKQLEKILKEDPASVNQAPLIIYNLINKSKDPTFVYETKLPKGGLFVSSANTGAGASSYVSTSTADERFLAHFCPLAVSQTGPCADKKYATIAPVYTHPEEAICLDGKKLTGDALNNAKTETYVLSQIAGTGMNQEKSFYTSLAAHACVLYLGGNTTQKKDCAGSLAKTLESDPKGENSWRKSGVVYSTSTGESVTTSELDIALLQYWNLVAASGEGESVQVACPLFNGNFAQYRSNF